MKWSGWASDVRSNELYEEAGVMEELRQRSAEVRVIHRSSLW